MNMALERSAKITKLERGSHGPPNGQIKACLLEAVAYAAGESWNDHPLCVSPTLASYGRVLNDAMPDADRQRLLPLVTRLVGTRDPALERRRTYVLADAAVRIFAPLALDATGLSAAATKLRALPEANNAVAAKAAWAAKRAAKMAAEAAAKAAWEAEGPAWAAEWAAEAAAWAAEAATKAAEAAAWEAEGPAWAAAEPAWVAAIATFEKAIDIADR